MQPGHLDLLGHAARTTNALLGTAVSGMTGALKGMADHLEAGTQGDYSAMQKKLEQQQRRTHEQEAGSMSQSSRASTTNVPAAVVVQKPQANTTTTTTIRSERGSGSKRKPAATDGLGSLGYREWQTRDSNADEDEVRSTTSSAKSSRSRAQRAGDHKPSYSRRNRRGEQQHIKEHSDLALGHADDGQKNSSNQRISSWLMAAKPPQLAADNGYKSPANTGAVAVQPTVSPSVAATMGSVPSEFQADFADLKAKDLVSKLVGSDADNLRDALQNLKKKVGSLSFNFRHDLFAWLDWCLPCCVDDSNIYPPLCAMMVMLLLYGFGIATFFLHLQYNSYCDQNLTTIGSGVKTSCMGWADECRVWGTTISLKAYLQYRAAAYVLLLLPFLYMPYMVLVSINQMVTDIIGTLVDTLEPDEGKRFDSVYNKQIGAKLDRANKIKENKDWEVVKLNETFTLVGDIMSQMDRDGHDRVVLFLFFIFHGVMGGISMYFDLSVYLTLKEHDSDQKCARYQNRLNAMAEAAKGMTMSLEFLSMWHFLTGLVWMILTVCYLLIQCRRNLANQASNRYARMQEMLQKKQEGVLRKNLAHRAAAAEINNYYTQMDALRTQQAQLQHDAELSRVYYTALQNQQQQGPQQGQGQGQDW